MNSGFCHHDLMVNFKFMLWVITDLGVCTPCLTLHSKDKAGEQMKEQMSCAKGTRHLNEFVVISLTSAGQSCGIATVQS